MAVKKCKHLDVSNVMAVNNLSDYWEIVAMYV